MVLYSASPSLWRSFVTGREIPSRHGGIKDIEDPRGVDQTLFRAAFDDFYVLSSFSSDRSSLIIVHYAYALEIGESISHNV